MPGDLGSWILGLQGPLPVHRPPLGGPARVHGNDRDAAGGGHLGQPVAELRGRDADRHPAEPLAAPATTKGLPACLSRVGEVQVLNADGAAALPGDEVEQGADGRAQPPIPSRGRQAIQHQRDVGRRPDRVAAVVDLPAGQMPGVQIHGQDSTGQRRLQRRHRHLTGRPRRCGIPPIPVRVIAQVIPDRAGDRLRRPLVGPVGEPDRAGQPVVAMRPVGQVAKPPGQLDLQPAFLGMHHDGAVPKRILGVPVSRQE
jgi:hypothetical protein